MTPHQKTIHNLRRVRNELPKLAKQYPEIIQKFAMGTYGCYDDSPREYPVCQTGGCLLGNAARLFNISNPAYYLIGQFSYRAFGEEEFPAAYDEDGGLNDLWNFLFNCAWSISQPTFDEAMQRIDYALKHDLNLPEWEYRKEPFI